MKLKKIIQIKKITINLVKSKKIRIANIMKSNNRMMMKMKMMMMMMKTIKIKKTKMRKSKKKMKMKKRRRKKKKQRRMEEVKHLCYLNQIIVILMVLKIIKKDVKNLI